MRQFRVKSGQWLSAGGGRRAGFLVSVPAANRVEFVERMHSAVNEGSSSHIPLVNFSPSPDTLVVTIDGGRGTWERPEAVSAVFEECLGDVNRSMHGSGSSELVEVVVVDG